MICLGKIRILFSCKDGAVIGSIGLIVGDLLYNHGCFLLVDQPDGLCDKFLRVVFEHGKGVWPDTCQNLCSRTTR